MIDNPFVTNGYAGPEYFCDRVEETALLTNLLTNGNNIALMSPRRVGKTDLIRHCFQQKAIKEGYYCFLIDIYATNSLHELLSVRSDITFDINGNPVWGLGVGTMVPPQTTLDEIFAYLRTAEKHCLVAIDEFQQILYYNDNKNVEAALRTQIQQCSNANFIFSGSQRHMMNGMFTSPSRPFYQAVTIINLKPLDLDVYTAFCMEKFEEAGKKLDADVVATLYQRFEAVTSYMHRILNVLYSRTDEGSTCVASMVDEAIDYILAKLP